MPAAPTPTAMTVSEPAITPAVEPPIGADHVLVVAPIGRDASLIVSALSSAGIAAHVVGDAVRLTEILEQLAPDAPGAAIIAEEALNPEAASGLMRVLARQPAWCELPIVLLAFAQASETVRARLIDRLGPAGSVSVVDRPVRIATLVNAVRVALRARARQFEARDLLLGQQRLADELRANSAELERSNADLEQFAYIASHDLQEPLRMISSYLEVLRRRHSALFDEQAGTFFQHAIDGARRMSEMIRSILHFSRLGGVAFVEFDAAEALSEALENLRPTIAASRASITVGALPRVRSDRTLLAQLLQNLISNGIKFSRGEPSIRIDAESADGGWIFRVADDGIGFPTDVGERAFQLFQRFHGDRSIPGTGLGLATCRKIVDLHGGRIWVTSQPGVGSVFSFTLAPERDQRVAVD